MEGGFGELKVGDEFNILLSPAFKLSTSFKARRYKTVRTAKPSIKIIKASTNLLYED